MGTSTNYKAPTSPQWRKLKGEVTRLTRRGIPSSIGIKGIIQDFVKVNYGSSHGTGSGGSKVGGTARRQAAQNVARKIGESFSSVADVGFREAFEDAGLGSLEGKSIREIVYSLVDYLGGPKSTLDETDAQTALGDLMDEILNDANSLEEVEEAIETRCHGASLGNLIQSFFGYYIYQQFCRVFYERLVANIGERRADESIDEIRDYICETVKYVVSDRNITQIDWNESQGQQVIDEILQETLEVFSV